MEESKLINFDVDYTRPITIISLYSNNPINLLSHMHSWESG